MRHLNSYLVLATLFFWCFVCYIVALIKDLKTGTLHIFLHQPVLGLQFQDLILNWNSVSNASKYNVYYSQSSSNEPWNLVDSTTDTYTDLTAYSAGTFYFVVIAINNNYVKSSYSSPAYCTIQSSGGGSAKVYDTKNKKWIN